jgi:hypothetical protein
MPSFFDSISFPEFFAQKETFLPSDKKVSRNV